MKTQGAHRGKPAVSARLVSGVAALTLSVAAVVFVAVPTVAGSAPERDGTTDRTTDRAANRVIRPATTLDAAPAQPGRRSGAASEKPLSSRLPSGKVVRIRPVATTRDGTLAVPGDIRVAGWWRGGSRLGDPFGSTLLAAHVDSFTQGLGPYAELLTVRAGQTIVLTSAHLRQKFSVTSLRLLAKGTLPSTPWVYSPRGARRAVLVTCAGPFVPNKGGYQRLAVVTARPVGPPTRRAA